MRPAPKDKNYANLVYCSFRQKPAAVSVQLHHDDPRLDRPYDFLH